jgi:hypothetical protein
MNPQTPQFSSGTHPFKFNDSYDLGAAGEANTYNQIYAETCFLYGSDVVFLPRTVNNPEPVFGEYLASTIESGFPMRLLVEDVTNWQGGGDIYSKFGLQVTDETTFNCPKIVFENYQPDPLVPAIQMYPKQGDLIYYVKGKKLFEILHVEDETQPGFYVFGNRNSYQIKCKAYTFDHMEIAVDDSIPTEISSLGGLADQDDTHFNEEIINTIVAESILDSSEVDPITGR